MGNPPRKLLFFFHGTFVKIENPMKIWMIWVFFLMETSKFMEVDGSLWMDRFREVDGLGTIIF